MGVRDKPLSRAIKNGPMSAWLMTLSKGALADMVADYAARVYGEPDDVFEEMERVEDVRGDFANVARLRGDRVPGMPWFFLYEQGGVGVYVGSQRNVNKAGYIRGRVLSTEEARAHIMGVNGADSDRVITPT